MAKKHAATATSALSILVHFDAILNAACVVNVKDFPVLHIVTGDAVTTNEAAVKVVCNYMSQLGLYRKWVKYRFVYPCVAQRARAIYAHLANTIICGRCVSRPLKGSYVCCNMVPYFKYLKFSG